MAALTESFAYKIEVNENIPVSAFVVLTLSQKTALKLRVHITAACLTLAMICLDNLKRFKTLPLSFGLMR